MIDFETRFGELVNEHVDVGLGPRRPAPPLPDTTSTPRTSGPRSRRWLPLLAAACVAAAVGVALVVARASEHGAQPAQPRLATWQRIHLPTDGRTLYGLTDVGFVDARHGWVVGRLDPATSGLVRLVFWTTADAGRTWTLHTPQLPGGRVIEAVTFGDASHGWLAATRRRRVDIYGTADGGRTWSPQATLHGDVTDLTAVDTRHAWLFGNRGFVAATADGQAWTQLPAPERSVPTVVDFLDPQRGWVVEAGSGHTYATADGGTSWAAVTNPPGTRFGPAALEFVTPDAGYAVAGRRVFFTEDGGQSWIVQVSVAQRLTAVAFADARRGWALGPAGGVRTTDAGRTWTPQQVSFGEVFHAATQHCDTLALTARWVYRYSSCSA